MSWVESAMNPTPKTNVQWDVVSVDQDGVLFPHGSEVTIVCVNVLEVKSVLGTDRLANVSFHLLKLLVKEGTESDLIEVIVGNGVRRSRHASVKGVRRVHSNPRGDALDGGHRLVRPVGRENAEIVVGHAVTGLIGLAPPDVGLGLRALKKRVLDLRDDLPVGPREEAYRDLQHAVEAAVGVADVVGIKGIDHILVGFWQEELVVVEPGVQLEVQLEDGFSAVGLSRKHAVSRGIPVVEGSHQENLGSGLLHLVVEVDHYGGRERRSVPFLWMCAV